VEPVTRGGYKVRWFSCSSSVFMQRHVLPFIARWVSPTNLSSLIKAGLNLHSGGSLHRGVVYSYRAHALILHHVPSVEFRVSLVRAHISKCCSASHLYWLERPSWCRSCVLSHCGRHTVMCQSCDQNKVASQWLLWLRPVLYAWVIPWIRTPPARRPVMLELDRACPWRLSLDAEFGGAERARSLV
jgi:hypothetical protein